MILAIISILLYYFFSFSCRKKFILNLFDPIFVNILFEGVWIFTLIYNIEDLTLEILGVSIVSIIAYNLSWLFLSPFAFKYKANLKIAFKKLLTLPKVQFFSILIIYLILLSTYTLFAVISNGTGNNRLDFKSSFRFSEYFINFSTIPILVLLHFKKDFQIKYLLYFIIFLLNIIIGGKSTLLILTYSACLIFFLEDIKLNIYKSFKIIAASSFVLGCSIVLAYGGNLFNLIPVLAERISEEGAIYLLADKYQIQLNNIFTYIFGPVMKLFFLEGYVEKNIGAQIFSIIVEDDVKQGPNAHLSILLFYSKISVWLSFIFSFLFTSLVLSFLFYYQSIITNKAPSIFMFPIVPLIFVYKNLFYVDPPYLINYFVGHIIVLVFLFILLFFVRKLVLR